MSHEREPVNYDTFPKLDPLSKESERPCATCNDDPEVCATVPGLRHCEKANRSQEKEHEAPTKLFVRVEDICGGVVSAATYPFPGATEYAVSAIERSKDIEVLGEYGRTDGHREWWSGGAWLHPGDEIVLRRVDGRNK